MKKLGNKKIWVRVAVGIVAVVVLAFLAFTVVKGIGKSRISKNAAVKGDTSGDPFLYHDKKYHYNTDLVNILCEGVDRDTSLISDNAVGKAGQADVLFLVSLNTKTDEWKLYSVPRESMTVVRTLDEKGELADVQTMQITLQYAVGRNGAESSELVGEAVSEIMCSIPIQRYAAINFNAFPEINDAVGGVTVTVEEESYDQVIADRVKGYEIGSTITLKGEDAFTFVRERNSYVQESSSQRLLRQKQYVKAFVPAAKKAIKKDITLPLKLKNIMKDDMVTDISLSEMAYLTTAFSKVSFDDIDIITLPGEEVLGNKYKEYYVDDEAVEDMVIDNFYQKE